jgi:hypothetical protein
MQHLPLVLTASLPMLFRFYTQIVACAEFSCAAKVVVFDREIVFILVQYLCIMTFYVGATALVVMLPSRKPFHLNLMNEENTKRLEKYIDEHLNMPSNKRWEQDLLDLSFQRHHPTVVSMVGLSLCDVIGARWRVDARGWVGWLSGFLNHTLLAVLLWQIKDFILAAPLAFLLFADWETTMGHTFMDGTPIGIWHHVDKQGDLDKNGVTAYYWKLAGSMLVPRTCFAWLFFQICHKSGMFLSVEAGTVQIVRVFTAAMTAHALAAINHEMCHRTKLPWMLDQIRKTVFMGFLWKYRILCDRSYHNMHHHHTKLSEPTSVSLLFGLNDDFVASCILAPGLQKHHQVAYWILNLALSYVHCMCFAAIVASA